MMAARHAQEFKGPAGNRKDRQALMTGRCGGIEVNRGRYPRVSRVRNGK